MHSLTDYSYLNQKKWKDIGEDSLCILTTKNWVNLWCLDGFFLGNVERCTDRIELLRSRSDFSQLPANMPELIDRGDQHSTGSETRFLRHLKTPNELCSFNLNTRNHGADNFAIFTNSMKSVRLTKLIIQMSMKMMQSCNKSLAK